MLEIHLRSAPQILEKFDRLLLDDTGRIKLLPAEFYNQLDRVELRIWCHFRSRYSITTLELVQWLKDRIGDRTAIEIGAGNADLGFHLGIHSTDSHAQQAPEIARFYKETGQIPTDPPDFVEKIEAIKAIKKYRPQVVVGAWITEKYTTEVAQNNIYGVDDLAILRNTREYIHIGSQKIHGSKSILSKPHKTFEFPWLVSRASDPIDDTITCWVVPPSKGFGK